MLLPGAPRPDATAAVLSVLLAVVVALLLVILAHARKRGKPCFALWRRQGSAAASLMAGGTLSARLSAGLPAPSCELGVLPSPGGGAVFEAEQQQAAAKLAASSFAAVSRLPQD